MRRPDESVALFINQVPRGPGSGIDFNEAQSLMAAIHFNIRKPLAIPAPVHIGRKPFMLEFLNLRLVLLPPRNVKKAKLISRKSVARLGIRACFQLRPASALR